MSRDLPVVEIFGPTIQGEGELIGRRTNFLRLGYCDGTASGWCTWCDSMYSVDPKYKDSWERMSQKEVAELLNLRSRATNCANLTITGGNPVMHDLTEFMGLTKGLFINVETQGTLWRKWLLLADMVTVSPKPPSAGEWDEKKFQDFLDCMADPYQLYLKIVVGDDADYEWAKYVINRYSPQFQDTTLSALSDFPWNENGRTRWLAEKVCNDPELPDVRVLFQYHKLLWGDRHGV